jgi:hypothetical protein
MDENRRLFQLGSKMSQVSGSIVETCIIDEVESISMNSHKLRISFLPIVNHSVGNSGVV